MADTTSKAPPEKRKESVAKPKEKGDNRPRNVKAPRDMKTTK